VRITAKPFETAERIYCVLREKELGFWQLGGELVSFDILQ